jgi:hypothetical protein
MQCNAPDDDRFSEYDAALGRIEEDLEHEGK